MVIMLDQTFKSSVNIKCAEHFDLACPKSYVSWRDKKIADVSGKKNVLRPVNISSYSQLSKQEKGELIHKCNQFGFAIYQNSGVSKEQNLTTKSLRFFAEQLGIRELDFHHCTEEDGVSVLQVSNTKLKRDFIPYSDKPLGWHTDGYYNAAEYQIRSMILHCVSPADDGGENQLMDHELMYIKLRDRNPEFIKALCKADCMNIPEFDDGEGNCRPESQGPVFYIDSKTARLQMRYTARQRNITWKNNAETQAAHAAITDILSKDEESIYNIKLKANQGLLSSNILHNRTGFNNNGQNQRKLYRARFYDSL